MLLNYVITSESEKRSWNREHRQTALEAANEHQYISKKLIEMMILSELCILKWTRTSVNVA